MKNKIIFTASIFGALAVMAGAFGTHGLQQHGISAKDLDVWRTAVQYQFYHTFVLLLLASLFDVNNRPVTTIYYLFTFGIIFFCGSLYLLSCRNLLGWDWLIFMGPVTPLGGLLFICGWFTMAWTVLKNK